MEDRTCTPGEKMWGMPSGSTVNKTWEYNDRADSYQEVPKDYIDAANHTVEIIGFGDPVAQPGPFINKEYIGKLYKDNPEAYKQDTQEKTYAPEVRPVLTKFEQELRRLINGQCVENQSNTPDFILAEYLSSCLNAFNVATQQRERWYGRKVF